ncbi:signal transduction histidine kinase/CheY-like chemotaxis protein [Actinoplanes lutulentus]|nr:SpoIIE family protein phosphatase [Actinoplanes lutulentus]MBB2947551.1 signal transduction histidine kinase/CheY-like chemotaxis protein [Actinoplanes lutulentus]
MTPAEDLFGAASETGRLMARLDWTGTRLGAIETWPQSLKAAVRIVLSSRYPMLLLWGPDFTQLYNDAYSGLIGDKHPAALGLDVRETLAEGWDVLRPLIDEAMATGVASWVPALQLLLDRSGYREEAYFSVSHAPARDDDGVTVGVLTVCSEVTDQVVGERRLRLLRDLALPDGDGPAGVERTCARLAEVLAQHPLDVPFAAIYLRDGNVLRRHALSGTDETALPRHLVLDAAEDDPWGLRAATGGDTAEINDVPLTLTGGPWGDLVRAAVTHPLPGGALVTGVSPSRALDETYRSFLQLLAQQVTAAISTAQAYQQERDRAAALAELDRVKTDFFTNVSHEFRTPLTLMLGPLGDALADRAEPLGPAQRTRVDTAWRNSTRLLSLVNELLTFAGIESGEPGASPHVVDLARYTSELAGVFRSAIERTGLRLVVDCPPLPAPVAVDPGHWERIVTNLLSNALKFTFVGEIRVRLESDGSAIRLSVSDTGIGIDASELPRLFDRFHRVRGARSRSHEGTGIGLALVRELSRLAGGDVEVVSTPGDGTTFTVTMPVSSAATVSPGFSGVQSEDGAPEPLDAARAAATETAGWIDETLPDSGTGAIRILVADDNGDMRAYLSRLLTAEGWQVQTAADGEAALQAIGRNRPHLLVTDVMMPRLDGFALVRKLRGDPATRSLPVVMLSARAGQESGVEGLAAGADDYVVKPFHARELIARIRNILELASLRAAHTEQLTALADTAAVIASGRALEEAFQTATDQARALLNGVSAVTVLDAGGNRPVLRFTAGAPLDLALDLVEAEIKGHDGTRIGSIAVRIDPESPPTEQSRTILTPLADMLASLAQSSWQLEHERQMTVTLQQAVLPESVPERDGWDLHTAYRPASGRVGGDWYDVAETADGSLVVSIGDVAGHGLGAAVTTGQIRNAVRAYLVEDPAPAHVIARVAALVGRLHTPFFATLLIIRFDPRTGRFEWCSAGHPMPVHSAPGVPARLLPGRVGPPLGLTRASYRQNTDTLEPGGQLLLYTDGLVEDFPKPIDEGLERLRTRCDREFFAGRPVTALVDAVLADIPQPQHDDVAVVAIRRHPAAAPAASLPEIDTTWSYPLGPAAAASARRDLQTAMRGDAVDPDLLYDLQVAATEAINNAVEHAQRPSRPEVRLRLRVTGELVRIEVQDFGGWRARPPARDRGRGAILMNAYGDVRVTATSTGTLVTIERRWTSTH